ncbi:MAG: hypothetical protein K5848_01460 [Lachnospiraceae bacterium]|nr:hypothetical protein [Lachnospiraceae bacterium]
MKRTRYILISAAILTIVLIVSVFAVNKRKAAPERPDMPYYDGDTMEIADNVKKIEMRGLGQGIDEGARILEITDKSVINRIVADINSLKLKGRRLQSGHYDSRMMIIIYPDNDENGYAFSITPLYIIDEAEVKYEYYNKDAEEGTEELFNYLWDVFWEMSEDAGYRLPPRSSRPASSWWVPPRS